MNYHNIKISELNMILDLIGYMHGKIAEESDSKSEDLHMISEDLIHSLSEFVDIEQFKLQTAPARAA
jgi:hypothetical protein